MVLQELLVEGIEIDSVRAIMNVVLDLSLYYLNYRGLQCNRTGNIVSR